MDGWVLGNINLCCMAFHSMELNEDKVPTQACANNRAGEVWIRRNMKPEKEIYAFVL